MIMENNGKHVIMVASNGSKININATGGIQQ